MAQPVPALTGWIEGAPEKLDYLFSAYFQSEHSQTNMYAGKVVSLPHQIQAFGGDQLSLKTVIGESLQSYLGRYFDSCMVEVAVDTTPDDPGRLTIRVDCVVAQDGRQYSAGREISALSNGQLAKIIQYNNEGKF